MDGSSQVGDQYKTTEACTVLLTSSGHVNPVALNFVTWDVLHKRFALLNTVYAPSGSSQGPGSRMARKSYCVWRWERG